MNWIMDILKSFGRLFVWWVVVLPWEEGIRVRLGKHRRRLMPGLRFRIPYADSIYKQSNRLRWTTMTPQTVTTRDAVTITVSGQVGYRITDMDKLYDTMHQAENGIRSIAQGAIADHVFKHDYAECSPALLAEGAASTVSLERYGLALERMQLTTFCRVKTYRLIMDQHENVWEDLLNTTRPDGFVSGPR